MPRNARPPGGRTFSSRWEIPPWLSPAPSSPSKLGSTVSASFARGPGKFGIPAIINAGTSKIARVADSLTDNCILGQSPRGVKRKESAPKKSGRVADEISRIQRREEGQTTLGG